MYHILHFVFFFFLSGPCAIGIMTPAPSTPTTTHFFQVHLKHSEEVSICLQTFCFHLRLTGT